MPKKLEQKSCECENAWMCMPGERGGYCRQGHTEPASAPSPDQNILLAKIEIALRAELEPVSKKLMRVHGRLLGTNESERKTEFTVMFETKVEAIRIEADSELQARLEKLIQTYRDHPDGRQDATIFFCCTPSK